MADFRRADQKASDEFALRELERARAGETTLSEGNPFLENYVVENLQRQSVLEAQRANPGSVVVRREGQNKLILPTATSVSGTTPAPSGGLLDLLNQESTFADEAGAGGLPLGWLLVAGVVLAAGIGGVLLWRSK